MSWFQARARPTPLYGFTHYVWLNWSERSGSMFVNTRNKREPGSGEVASPINAETPSLLPDKA